MRRTVALLSCLVALTGAARAEGDGIHVRVLENGLRVVVKEDHSKPLAALRIYVRTGGAFEMEFLGCGISHYYEHLLSGGTTSTRPETESARILREIGGQSNAYTASDHTCYHVTTHKDFLARAIDLYGDWMMNNVLDPAEVEREKGVILKEINMGEDEPARVMSRLFLSTFYTTHPVRVPNIGYRENFSRLTRDDLLRYYRNRYAPDNSVVAVAGDVDPEAVFEMVKKAMGGWERRPLPVVSLPAEPRQSSPRRAEGEHDVSQVWARMAWHTIDLFHPDLYALDMAAAVLSEGRASRLFRRAVEEEGLTEQIDAWSYTPWYMPGNFGVAFQAPSEKVDRALAVVREEIARLKAGPVTQEELDRARTLTIARYQLNLQSVEDQASQVGQDLLTTGDARFSQKYVERIGSVTPEEVVAAARRWLPPEGETVALLRPRGTAAGTGASAGGAAEAREVREERLPNGAVLLVRRIPGIAPVAVETFVHGGLRAEDPAKNGVANLTARLLLRGTASRSGQDIARALEEVGGSITSQGGNNTLGLSITLARGRRDLPLAAEILADVLANASFPDAEFAREHRLAVQAAGRLYDEWQTEAFIRLRREVYGACPYANPTVGTPETLAGVTRDDVLAFARRWIDPRGMVVAVAGDVDLEETLALLRKAVGGLAGRGDYAPPSPVAPEWAGGSFAEDRFAFHANDKKQAVLNLAFAGPAYADYRDRAALLVVDAFTSGIDLPSGWLHEALRGGGRSLVYFIHLSFFAGMEGGLVSVTTQTETGLLGEVHGLLMKEIDRLRRGEYSDEDLAVGRAMALVAGPYGRQTVNDVARDGALGELYGLGHEFEAKFEETVAAVTREDVKRVVDRYFGKVLVMVTGPESARAAFEALKPAK